MIKLYLFKVTYFVRDAIPPDKKSGYAPDKCSQFDCYEVILQTRKQPKMLRHSLYSQAINFLAAQQGC